MPNGILRTFFIQNKFNCNGDLSPDESLEDLEEELNIDITPKEFVKRLAKDVEEVLAKLSDPELTYCNQKINGYVNHIILSIFNNIFNRREEDILKQKHNQAAFEAFPLTQDQAISLFGYTTFSRAQSYIESFYDITSTIKVCGS
jgi:hypothetical protein